MKYHYTVYKIDLKGKKSNKENLNDNELDKWMDKVHGKFANIRVERSDGKTIDYTDDGTKFVIKKKGMKEGRMQFKDYLLNEATNDKLIKKTQSAQSAFNKALDAGKDTEDLNRKLQDLIKKAQNSGIPAIKGVYGRQ